MEREDFVSVAGRLAEDIEGRADEADKEGALPAEDVQALRDSGYLALSVPREYGGEGLSLRDCLAAHLALSQGSASTAMVAGMQMHVFGHGREVGSWSEAHMSEFCRLVVEEGALFNNLASEPAMGSPSRGHFFKTVAVAEGDGWRLNGHKTWSTGGTHLTHMLVKCMVGDEPGVLLVEQGREGIEWKKTWSESLSLRASDSHDVIFEDVWVPGGHVVERGKGPRTPNMWFPMVMCTVYLGAAIAARNTVIKFALERVPTALGKPIATLPKIQRQIGEIDLALQAARALLFDVAAEWTGDNEQRAAFFPRIAAAKTLVTETANDVTDKALRIAGGSSITRALPLERYFRDVRAGLMQPPSGDTALEIIGRNAIGPVPEVTSG
ncbi:MAG TPA: acyl-CoA dehydrogenase family protein [Anaerolineae bacterium]|nr:acyl-CoA dehydrogenase family protein [Anaerolineae bacterium]